MELLYSMRRKPLKCEPPHFDNPLDPEVVRPIVTMSVCNIIAFSSPTELSDADGDTWGGHVYVCDMDTPWDSHKVTSTVHPVSALEWDSEGKNLLVATTAGDVTVYGQKEYLLNEWASLYTASFPGEHIVRAIFFHNGRRVAIADKKPDALITEKFQLLRPAPTLKGFGGVSLAGALVVTASGLVGAIFPGEGTRAHSATEPLRPARPRVTTAALAHKNGTILVAAACIGLSGICVRCCAASPRSPRPALTLQPLPALHLPAPSPVTLSWSLRDETDCLLVAGTTLTLWKLAEGAHPVHKLLAKGPLQGSTTPNSAPKPGTDCFNTVVWQPGPPWAIEDGARAVAALGHKLPLAPPYVLLATPRSVHLLHRDNHHTVCVCAVPLRAGAEAGACSPPKKHKYGPNTGAGDGCATVCSMDVSWLGGAAVCVDSHARLHVYRLPYCSDMLCSMDVSWLGGAAVCVDSHARLHVYRLPYCSDMPSPMALQHTCNLLEYSLVTGTDCLDVLLTIKSSLVEAVYERFTESFQRQPAAFQQYYYHGWLKLRIALCRLVPSLSTSASWLMAVQMCLCAWAAVLPALRPDDRSDLGLDDDNDKSLIALEAKPESCGDVSLVSALRRHLQRALDVACAALLSLQHSGHQAHGYEIWADPTAVTLLRKLIVIARAAGRGGEALSRPLARLQSNATKHDLQEECASVGAAGGARAWEGAPRCGVSAPHARTYPLYLEYGVEPESLRFIPEPPTYLQADVPPPRQMDTVRYMYLGGGGAVAKWRLCGRCGAAAAPPHTATNTATPPLPRAPLLHAADARLQPACRCGGKWTLVSNV